jgi:hypothetical protein
VSGPKLTPAIVRLAVMAAQDALRVPGFEHSADAQTGDAVSIDAEHLRALLEIATTATVVALPPGVSAAVGFRSRFCSRDESALHESTRTPVFVVLDRNTRDRVERIEGVWLTRQEAEEHVGCSRYNYRNPLVYGVPANGELVDALRDGSERDAKPTSIHASTEHALRAVLAERHRQVDVEGWTEAHDDEHDPGELAAAASSYALSAASFLSPYQQGDHVGSPPPDSWPWSGAWWKPKDARRDLERAGALILAELEKLDRDEQRKSAAVPA